VVSAQQVRDGNITSGDHICSSDNNHVDNSSVDSGICADVDDAVVGGHKDGEVVVGLHFGVLWMT
jgi:hypothetical protein